jgi:ABC-type Fe3+-citrate transport system substrate-binding protein
MTRLTRENVADLAALSGFQWGFVNQSVGMTISGLMEAASRCEAKLAIHEKTMSELMEVIENERKAMLLSVPKTEGELQSMKHQQEVEHGQFERD